MKMWKQTGGFSGNAVTGFSSWMMRQEARQQNQLTNKGTELRTHVHGLNNLA
jgi:hypothetical protein